MKRFLDLIISGIGLIFLMPIFILCAVLVFLQDRHSPLYCPMRVGKDEILFKMYKLRSMVIGADKTGVDSTAKNDARITGIGKIIRKFKLDELTQLINVFNGSMSMVGPRPNVKRETDIYTVVEKGLLLAKPGVTDFSSIIFSDEAEILAEANMDPDIAYNQLIRPWKSKLGLFYLKNISIWLDLKLILYTAISIFSREKALCFVANELKALGADNELVNIARRKERLYPTPPPGSDQIITFR